MSKTSGNVSESNHQPSSCSYHEQHSIVTDGHDDENNNENDTNITASNCVSDATSTPALSPPPAITNKHARAKKQLIIACLLCFVFMIGEFVGGWLANSLAIMSDAAHLLTDLASFVISLIALCLSARPATKRMPYGWARIEVLGALLSILFIWVLIGVMMWLAVSRFLATQFHINAGLMLVTSVLGLFFNIIMGFTLHQSSDANCPHQHTHSHFSFSQSHSHAHTNSHAHSLANSRRHSHNSNTDTNNAVPSGSHLTAVSIATATAITTPPKNRKQQQRRLRSRSHRNSTTEELRPLNPLNGEEQQILRHHHRHHKEENNQLQNDEEQLDSDISCSVELGRLENGATVQQKHLQHSQQCNQKNLNLRAAFIHVVGDFVQSFGVFIVAIIIYFKPNLRLADPICTVTFSLVAIATTLPILQEIVSVLLHRLPAHLDCDFIRQRLLQVSVCALSMPQQNQHQNETVTARPVLTVSHVKNLRIWCLSNDQNAHLTALIGTNAISLEEQKRIMYELKQILEAEFQIFESTLQTI